MCNLGGKGEGKNRADMFLNCDPSTSLSPVGRLVLCVDKKGGYLYDVILESILFKRAPQISTVSLFHSLIWENLCYKNPGPFPKTSIV